MVDGKGVHHLLESEHRWLDERFDQFQHLLDSGRVDGGPFHEAARVLHRHIYLEEEILFPRLETRGLSDPISVMAQEHREICRHLGGVEGLLERNASAEQVASMLTDLRSLLKEHNFKEEGILYPAAEGLLTEQELPEVLEALRESQPPEGWVCRAHRCAH
ncbi:MAG: hemerythrin domain-containing protein [Dehalococcoidia bacterium]